MRMGLLSIFLEDFRGPRKTVFRLKIMRSKMQVIMACCRTNVQTSRVLFFHSENREIASLAFKMKRKNISRCLGGLRMDNHGEWSPQTFLVNNFSFLQPRRKLDDRCAFK